MKSTNLCNLKITPYPYQLKGIERGIELKRYINGDECGLGKTLMALATIATAGATPALVICPSSLKINWQREVEKFTNLKALILTDSVKSTFPYLVKMKMFDVVITNYESLRKYFVLDAPNNFTLKDVVFQPSINIFKSVILDESHRVKDSSAQQSKFTRGICKDKEWVIMLTGTPVVNSPMDLATQIAIMGRIKEFGGLSYFKNRYSAGENLNELNAMIHDMCYFRREKKEVFQDMPKLTRSTVFVELDKCVREEYDTCLNDLRQYLSEYRGLTDTEIKKRMRMKALVKFMNLRHISSMGKVMPVISMVRDMNTNVVIFCSHHDIVDQLLLAFPNAVTVTGRDSQAEKQAAVDAFQSREVNIIICSIKAAGVGLTLTASSHEIFVELPWTYADLTQCEAREDRIGQKESVNSYIALGKDSIDDRLFRIIMDKRSIASKITGSDDDIPSDERYFEELMSCINESGTGKCV